MVTKNYYILAFYEGNYVPKEHSAPFFATQADAIWALEQSREEYKKIKPRSVELFQQVHHSYFASRPVAQSVFPAADSS
jgi:hypothetical protein